MRSPKIRIQGHMFSDSNKAQMSIAVSLTKGFHMYHHIRNSKQPFGEHWSIAISKRNLSSRKPESFLKSVHSSSDSQHLRATPLPQVHHCFLSKDYRAGNLRSVSGFEYLLMSHSGGYFLRGIISSD